MVLTIKPLAKIPKKRARFLKLVQAIQAKRRTQKTWPQLKLKSLKRVK
jgi:hypothetical protein